MVELRADIELPLPPPFPWIEVAGIAIATALLVGAIALARAIADRSASKMRSGAPGGGAVEEIQTQAADAREQAYRAAALLRAHFKLPRLDPAQPPREVNDAATWKQVVDQLTARRYQTSARDALPDDVLAAIRQWLNTAPGAGEPG